MNNINFKENKTIIVIISIIIIIFLCMFFYTRINMENEYNEISNYDILQNETNIEIEQEETTKIIIHVTGAVKNETKEREYTKKDIDNLKTKLEYIFPELIKQTNLVPNKIRIRNIKYAWGSCSSNKNITINLKLVDKSEEEIKYVVLHELCHLKYMNHSDKFWNLVEKYMPNYKEIRKQLKNNR